MIDLKTVGEKLKEKRAQMDLTTRELGDKCGITGGYISLVELGKKTPSLTVLANIATALNVSCSYLLGEEDIALQSHVFPNGLTYLEMDAKIKKYEALEKALEGLKK